MNNVARTPPCDTGFQPVSVTFPGYTFQIRAHPRGSIQRTGYKPVSRGRVLVTRIREFTGGIRLGSGCQDDRHRRHRANWWSPTNNVRSIAPLTCVRFGRHNATFHPTRHATRRTTAS